MALPSALQTVALNQLEAQFWSLVESMHDWFQTHPTANAATALAALEALTDPAPNDDVKIVDRTALFNWLADRIHPYEGQATAYLSLRQLMLDHPKAFIKLLDRDSGRTGSTRAELLGKRLTNSGPSTGWDIGGISGVSLALARDPAKGNFVTSETWTATIDGVQRQLRLTYSVTSDGNGGWNSAPAAWSIL